MLSFVDQHELQFIVQEHFKIAHLTFYTENGEWELTGSRVYTLNVPVANYQFDPVPTIVVNINTTVWDYLK